jgi:hypothetical protein
VRRLTPALPRKVGCPFFLPKDTHTGATGGLFDKMFCYFRLRWEEFLEHYHQRSNVGSTFSMVKQKFGDSVRSKTDEAMMNEVLCKLLAHNVCVIAAWYELGIEPMFGGQSNEGPAVLQFGRPG